MKRPRKHYYGKGWLVGTLPDGAPVYSDGYLLLRGTPPSTPIVALPPEKWDRLVRRATGRLRPTRVHHTYNRRNRKRALYFRGGSAFDSAYVREIRRRFPRCRFYLGPFFHSRARRRAWAAQNHHAAKARYLIAKEQGKLAAILAPLVGR